MATVTMPTQLLLAAFLGLGAVFAAPASSYSTSVSKQQTCITRMRPGYITQASLPTSTRTSAQTITSTQTVSGSAEAKIETVTPAAITSTKCINATVVASGATGEASASTVYVTVSYPNATAGDSACTRTSTISADATSTVYTGSYNGTIAKRTATPMDLEKRGHPFGHSMGHWFGKSGRGGAMSSAMKPFEVDCLEQATTYLIATSSESAVATTSTVTAEREVVVVTSTETPSGTGVAPARQTMTSTVTAAPASGNSTAGSVCTVTQGQAAATTTQHLKCAPTNLISEIDGYGIGATQGHANETQGLAPGSDPSACCQLCIDTEGCAASEDDQDAGNCFLWYTTPSCGLGFTYANGGEDLAPGKGFLVQSGCGYIQPGPDPDIQ